jgi:aspartyl-tRNA(Asn)/glutamyl-tRNA(Gln) amidotransferase subunit A
MPDVDLLRMPLHEVAPLVERRDVSPVELTELSLAAIDAANPILNAFRLTLPERALAAARLAEAEIGEGAYRGLLHGIPLGIKDLMDIAGETTPAGSTLLAERVADADSEVVRRLDAAGAVIVGKTHLPEFAYHGSSVNPHYGPVRNPWDLERDTGGSSSGTGSAVAAGLVFGATGSDTGGSIRNPSTQCGLAGIKPTFGRVSARGAVTLGWSLDHMGPMTRTVRDAALMLAAMAGFDPGDPRTSRRPVPDYVSDLEAGVSGLRIAVLEDDGGPKPLGTPAVERGFVAAAQALEQAGAEVTPLVAPEMADLAACGLGLLWMEASATYERFLRESPQEIGAPARERLYVGWALGPDVWMRTNQARTLLRERFAERMRGFDLLLLPGMPYEAPPLATMPAPTRYQTPFNLLGWPAMVTPSGLGERGLPVGVQIVGRPWHEGLVFRAARSVEQSVGLITAPFSIPG